MKKAIAALFATAFLAMPVQAQDWNGWYAGVFGGASGGGYADEVYSKHFPYAGVSAGVFGGYRFETGVLLVGVEGSAMLSTMERTEDIWFTNTVMGMGTAATTRGVIAYDLGSALPYVAAGATVGNQRFISGGPGLGQDSVWHIGAQFAVGVDLSITDAVFLRTEINYTQFTKGTYDIGLGPFSAWPTEQVGGLVGIGMKF